MKLYEQQTIEDMLKGCLNCALRVSQCQCEVCKEIPRFRRYIIYSRPDHHCEDPLANKWFMLFNSIFRADGILQRSLEDET